ncbi:CDP-diacylglycerol/serine O-phosphatidyltransferase [Thioalkalivibrio sp. K90mix]|uniref:CDP-diacylglycerol--serine O-phosphatidyltransferase n=1 Tax=Thioalkalivibrio sp. (strain K90mix) TaxID=396595 RepID=UPI000195A6AE|nr:CDP-diacylglycerol--serine O-phosphatidyltransferase [Thioalkalivibrio sp. K90mix]ADC72269.1 CDP-diacylglycerol/serine O-phosphatidyltransferase [Thioalkalivibrio sp. K90mix]
MTPDDEGSSDIDEMNGADERHEGRARRRRGIFLLPNLFTTGVLFSGFFAIVSAINGEFTTAAIAVFVAMVLDTLDGRVARMTDTQSEFGAQYDSLSDLVSFGVAPALVVYLWQLQDLGNLGWVAAFFFATAAALRLARFNSRLAVVDKRFFQGLPSPAAAALVVGMVWVLEDLGIPADLADPYVVAILIVTVLAGAGMVSNLTYFSFKDMDFKHRVPFLAIVGVVGALMLLALDPPKVLWAGFVVYALSGPLLTLERWRRHRRRTPSGD